MVNSKHRIIKLIMIIPDIAPIDGTGVAPVGGSGVAPVGGTGVAPVGGTGVAPVGGINVATVEANGNKCIIMIRICIPVF